MSNYYSLYEYPLVSMSIHDRKAQKNSSKCPTLGSGTARPPQAPLLAAAWPRPRRTRWTSSQHLAGGVNTDFPGQKMVDFMGISLIS
jgi:hypothetical protein